MDHLFVLVDSEARALWLEQAGMVIVRRGLHKGGGTGNIVYRFRNALLELAYPIDPDEIAGLGEIGFSDRWDWRQSGHSPFGVVVQIDRCGDLPFATWEYRPPFLQDTTWTIGQASAREPLYMVAPFDADHRHNPDLPELESVAISCPGIITRSQIANVLDKLGICQIRSGPSMVMELGLRGSSIGMLDLRPGIPLVIHWLA